MQINHNQYNIVVYFLREIIRYCANRLVIIATYLLKGLNSSFKTYIILLRNDMSATQTPRTVIVFAHNDLVDKV